MTVLTRLTPVTPGAISDPGIQNANRPLTISEIDSNFSDLYNFVYGKLAKTTDTFTGTLTIAGQLRFNGSVSGYVGFQSASTTANVLYTLPTSDGLNGQVLSTNGTGTLSWINQSAGGGGGGSGSGTSTSRTAFTATAGQTTFSVTYVVGQIDVYMNGSKLIVGTEVTASNGTSIVLAETAGAGDIVEAVVYSTQWISSGSNLYYDQGNVGFGVTNPAARIHVGSAATALATGTLRIDGADGAGTVNAPVTLNSVTDGATASGGSQFYIETRVPGGALTEKFRIDGDGNIGINNANPQSALDVTGNVRISGTTTLSAGTTNGLLYLNGSKVATSGSALTFDGTTFVNTVGGVSAKSAFELSGGANAIKTLYLSNYADAAANWNYIRSSSGSLDIYATGSNSLAFGASGTEGMRLTSTGLGIGTSSPQTRLEANQTGVGSVVIPIVAANQDTSTTGTGAGIGFVVDGVNDIIGAQVAGIRTGSAYHQSALAMYTRDSGGSGLLERMRLDSSGNLGLGVTPSAWDLFKGIQVLQGSITSSGNTPNNTLFASNAYYNSGFKYISSSTATLYQQDGGTHKWYTAPSGTAGNAISFGDAKMMLDASGNLGVGTTPSYKLDVVGQSRIGHQVLQAAPSSTAILSTAHVMLGGYGGNYLTIGQYDGTGGFAQWIQSSYENPTTAKYNIAFQPLGGSILIGGIAGTVQPALNRYVSLQSQTNNDIVGYNLFVNEGVNNRRGSMFLNDSTGVFGWDVTASTGVPDYAWYYAGTEKMRLVSSVGNLLIGESYDVNAKLKIYAGNNAQHIRIYEGNHDGSSSTFYYPALSYYARRDNVVRTGDPLSQYGSTASIVFTDRPGTSNYPTAVRTSDIQFWTASNDGGTGLDANPQLRMSITAEGSILAFNGFKSSSNSPISFISNGNSGVYNSTVIYANANNTSNSINNGIFIERGRLTDSSSAEIRNFVIGSRGGEVQFVLNKDGNVGIGDTSPTNRLTVNGGARIGYAERVVVGWFQGSTAGNASPGSPMYYHIKTNLWAGSAPTGNSQPTMSLIKVTGYDYSGQTILAMIGFHNWSGSLVSLTTQNLGQRDIGLTGLVSADGYVVIRINVSGASYQAWSIDWQQTWLYTWIDIKVTDTALSSSTNYY